METEKVKGFLLHGDETLTRKETLDNWCVGSLFSMFLLIGLWGAYGEVNLFFPYASLSIPFLH